MPKFIIKISASDKSLLNNEDVCCYLVDSFSNPSIVKEAKKSDKLVLAYGENAAAFCLENDLDGVMTSEAIDEKFSKHIKSLQKQIGAKKFLSVKSDVSRHSAMIASETEPAFVAFDDSGVEAEIVAEILDWYAELFLIQSALFYHPQINESLLEKTDFLIINTPDYKILVDKIERLD